MLPVHLTPQTDEILSSWLVRLAMAHGMKVHSFCSISFPQNAIWNRDIDKCANDDLLKSLSLLTATSIERVRETTLADLEGFLYEKHNTYGPNPWLLPIGVYHRKRIQFGMQYCSRCLSEDNIPYFRRKWRLTFMIFCEKHKVLLKDRCSSCQSPVNFHRNELGDFHKLVSTSLTICHICHTDLREVSPAVKEDLIKSSEILFLNTILSAIQKGAIRVSESEQVYSILFFQVLHQLMKTLAKNDLRIIKLRKIIIEESKATLPGDFDLQRYNQNLDIQEQPIDIRRELLFLAGYLLTDWPRRFVRLSEECKIWSSLWLKNMDGSPWKRSKVAPYWFWKIIYENLNRKTYNPTKTETEEALNYLFKRNITANRSAVSRLLGRTYIRRNYNVNFHT
jgi:TniQ